MKRKRSSYETGKVLEDQVARWLDVQNLPYTHNKKFSSAFGTWDIDFYVHEPPALISCKHPTSEAKQPGGSVIRKAQEAFFQLYGLMHLCPDVPPEAPIVLVTGDLPLKTRGKDYEALLAHLLGERFSVVRASNIEALGEVLKVTVTELLE